MSVSMNAPFKPETLPEWRLDDLYAGREDPRITADLQAGADINARLGEMKGPFVAALAPFAGQIEFVVARQQRLTHGSLDETQVRALSLGIVDISHPSLPSRLGGPVLGCDHPWPGLSQGARRRGEPLGPMVRRFFTGCRRLGQQPLPRPVAA